jgi:hypothetical protein
MGSIIAVDMRVAHRHWWPSRNVVSTIRILAMTLPIGFAIAAMPVADYRRAAAPSIAAHGNLRARKLPCCDPSGFCNKV